MKKSVINRLTAILCVAAVILIAQASFVIVAEQRGDFHTAGTTRSYNPPKSGAALQDYLLREIEAMRTDGSYSNDALTEMFYACDADGIIRLRAEDAAPYITASDGTPVFLSDVDSAYQSRVPQSAFEQMIEIGETYVAHANELRYANRYTPFNDKTTNHIDCSSFVSLVLYGVPYETSRYVSFDDKNTAKYDFGIHLPDNPYDNTYGPKRYLANQLAHYAYDQGFAFYPNADASNVQPGDILFFSTSETDSYFMDITHVAVCVERQQDDYLLVLHGNSFDVANYYQVRLFSDKTVGGSNNVYKNALVLAARFPVKENSQEP